METNVARQQAANPKLEAHLGYWLRLVSNPVSGSFARALQARQTSVAEWVAMCRIRDQPGTTPAELAAKLHMTRGAVSKVLDKLEEKNWVTRVAKPSDGRVQLLSLTRQGRRILPQLEEIADRNDHAFFEEALSAAERATLRRLLTKLAEYHQIREVPVE